MYRNKQEKSIIAFFGDLANLKKKLTANSMIYSLASNNFKDLSMIHLILVLLARKHDYPSLQSFGQNIVWFVGEPKDGFR